MIVMNDSGHALQTGSRAGGVDDSRWVIVTIDLTAFDVLKPAVLGYRCHRGTFRRVGVQHCKENAAQSGRIDVLVEETDVGIIRLGDTGIGLGMFGIPFCPSTDQVIVQR